jgi:rhamnosyltransferase
MKNVFIIGSKGIPARYGGFETFVDKLTEKKQAASIKYHVACLSYEKEDEFEFNKARCFNVKIKNIGSASAISYDIKALNMCYDYIQANALKDCVIYILACRIGPYLNVVKGKFEKAGIKIFVNPDGHEWKRSKWSWYIKKYWKISEGLMVKNADLLICDSIGIENYIKRDYSKYNPKTTFIAYGADIEKSKLLDNDEKLLAWYNKFQIKTDNYYLIVGRFVPENNYELMIREFMLSKTNKELVIITNHEDNKYYDQLLEKTNFKTDERIKFVGTVYDQELLKKIRENAFAYLHGHEVGGTNPSLLEALASTKVNLLLDVVFNKEVGADGALYFSKNEGDLANNIDSLDSLVSERINELDRKSEDRIKSSYSWGKIVDEYEEVFINFNI